MSDYLSEVEGAAVDALREYKDTIIELLADEGEVPTCIRELPGGDSFHHETHIDNSYDLEEAAEIIADLYQYEETDSGLWDRQEPEEAIKTKAAFTYGNAVYSEFSSLMESINEEYESQRSELWDEGHLAEDEDKPDWWDSEYGDLTSDKLKEIATAVVEAELAKHEPEPEDTTSHTFTMKMDFTVSRTDGGEMTYEEMQEAKRLLVDFMGSVRNQHFLVQINHEVELGLGFKASSDSLYLS